MIQSIANFTNPNFKINFGTEPKIAMFAQLKYNSKKGNVMKTKQIMKIEYTEPLMKVKEMRRRRCVVANSNEVNDSLQDYAVLDGNGDAAQSDDFGW